MGIPAPGKEACADSNSAPDLGYAKQSGAHCINCCAISQGLGYLGHTSSTNNPDEKTIYKDLEQQLKDRDSCGIDGSWHVQFPSEWTLGIPSH